ncbi:HNH endonuclease [Clostridium gasigenes]|uniref:HNH endonuclease n=1 Tax=Clostridium gasigenes TaxID=94869 RepID=UPI001C0BDE79|nr:HNH endonuclease [Clostridium gasigenes]
MESKHWKKRTRALCNAGFSCQECGNRRSLQVHHLSYKNLGQEPDYDLKVLCRNCHRETHNIQ